MTRAACRVALLLALLSAGLARAASDYSITPLRIELDRNARSAVVTLGTTGDEPIDFQVSAMEWSQDGEGRDAYAPTSELVFFPKIFTMKAGESRVIRVGAQSLPPATERTYRLFVEPIPKRRDDPLPPGANVSVTLRFALPVFVKPPLPHAAGDIERLALRQGQASLVVRNTGNEHLRFDEGAMLVGRDAAGTEILAQKLELRYVLAGSSKPLSFAVPKDVCPRLATLDVTAQATQINLKSQVATPRTGCE
jgi:fimbrial chaperone protein